MRHSGASVAGGPSAGARATDLLRQEHRLILRVLECLTAATEHAETGHTLDVRSIHSMIEFFRVFVDRDHHGKEEAHFFPAARSRGVVAASASVDTLLAEHEECRNRLRAMDESLSAIERDEADAKARFFEHARRLVILDAEHIAREERCLLSVAEKKLTESDQDELLQAFRKREQKELPPGATERVHALADELCARWGVRHSSSS